MRVRLLDCWAPEINKAAQRMAGLAARDHLLNLLQAAAPDRVDCPCRVIVPLDAARDVGDITTLGRLLAHVHLRRGDRVDPQSLSTHQTSTGHATTRRAHS